jgi:hypothetical protein
MHTEPIRRRDNGAIDIDFYRQRALSERTVAISGAGRWISSAARTALAAARHFLLTASRSRPLPDPGAMMLIAQTATKRAPI